MTEIFTDIPEYVKIQSKFWVDRALKQNNPITAIQIIQEYRDSCINEKEKEYVDFYFNYRMEQIRNESIND